MELCFILTLFTCICSWLYVMPIFFSYLFSFNYTDTDVDNYNWHLVLFPEKPVLPPIASGSLGSEGLKQCYVIHPYLLLLHTLRWSPCCASGLSRAGYPHCHVPHRRHS